MIREYTFRVAIAAAEADDDGNGYTPADVVALLKRTLDYYAAPLNKERHYVSVDFELMDSEPIAAPYERADLQKDRVMQTSEQINEIALALAKAQAEMSGAAKSSANPFFKSKYADLASVVDACRGALTTNQIAVVQSPTTDGPRVSLETWLIHSSGQYLSGTVTATAKDDSPQAVGSAITYLRRYALQSFAGVAPEDDDAETAQGRGARPTTAAAAPVPPAPDGYDVWAGALAAAGAEGIEALRKAWAKAPDAFRQHMMTANLKGWETMKAAADQVTAKKAGPKAIAS